jgi:hypothetical protein
MNFRVPAYNIHLIDQIMSFTSKQSLIDEINSRSISPTKKGFLILMPE